MFDENKWNEMNGENEKENSLTEGMSSQQDSAQAYGQADGRDQHYGQEHTTLQGADAGQDTAASQGTAAGQDTAPNQGASYGRETGSGQGTAAGYDAAPNQGTAYGRGTGAGQGTSYGQNPAPGQPYSYGQGGWQQNRQSQPGDQNRQGQPGQNQPGYQGQPGRGGQPRNPYSSPYPYTNQYYQNQSQGHNQGYGPNPGPVPNQGQAPNGHGPENEGRRRPKKNSFMRTTAVVTAAALLFGVVAGGTMFGVNRAAGLIFPQAANSTQASLETTPTVPSAQPSASQSSSGTVIEDVSAIVEAAMPSVVAITNTMLYKSNTWYGQTQTYEIPSSGSGIIVGQNDSELLIVTNNHVVEDATSLQVTFIDESTVEAAIKGTDSESDLAVIAIPLDTISADTKSKIKAATLGDSDSLKMGQGVIAIGNALGHGQSVTVGHVSALNREIQVDGVKKTVIQTDAAINPGNSGGALLNANGELIGINEAKYASTEVEGVGYAIPISFAKEIIDDLKSRMTKIEVAEEEQGYLGIQVQNIDAATSKMYGMPQGVYVYKIMEESAASGSDLREKDIITKFDGETVKSNADLTNLLTYYKAGSTVSLTVQSLENGQYVERQVQVTLKNRPQENEQNGNQSGVQDQNKQG